MPTPATTYTADNTPGIAVDAYLKTGDDFFIRTADGENIVLANHNPGGIYTADTTLSTTFTPDSTSSTTYTED